jgi:hypothetical protein
MKYWFFTLLVGWLTLSYFGQDRQKAVVGLEVVFRRHPQYLYDGINTNEAFSKLIYHYKMDPKHDTLIILIDRVTTYLKTGNQDTVLTRYGIPWKDISECKMALGDAQRFDLAVFDDKLIWFTPLKPYPGHEKPYHKKELTIRMDLGLTDGPLFRNSWSNLGKANHQARRHS